MRIVWTTNAWTNHGARVERAPKDFAPFRGRAFGGRQEIAFRNCGFDLLVRPIDPGNARRRKRLGSRK